MACPELASLQQAAAAARNAANNAQSAFQDSQALTLNLMAIFMQLNQTANLAEMAVVMCEMQP